MRAIELTEADAPKVEEFAGSLFIACLATMELANVELGVRLGLYETLAGAGPVTATELADARRNRAALRARVARAAGGRGRGGGRRHREAARMIVGSSCRTRTRTCCSTTTVKRA